MRNYEQNGQSAQTPPNDAKKAELGFNLNTFRQQSASATVGLLDAFGTSQKSGIPLFGNVPGTEYGKPLKREIDQMRERAKGQRCYKDAPLICIPGKNGVHSRIFQGTCNDWNCPRCGMMRANTEFARITKGVTDLAKLGRQFFMITYTCRGNVTSRQAELDYLEYGNALKTALRYQVKKSGGTWEYVEVTERQRRHHPHSHLITTFTPTDAYAIDNIEGYRRYVQDVGRLNTTLPIEMKFSPKKFINVRAGEMFSMWLSKECVKLGLGVQVNISRVQSIRAVTNYLAKYLFKSALDTRWPKGWRRIRYSQSWPKFEETADTGAFAVLSAADWYRVATLPGRVYTDEPETYRRALLHECPNVYCTVENEIDLPKAPPKWYRTDEQKYGTIRDTRKHTSD